MFSQFFGVSRGAEYLPLFSCLSIHFTLPLSCRLEFISNQRATDERPILITLSFAYLHINDCRLGCFSAAVALSPLLAPT